MRVKIGFNASEQTIRDVLTEWLKCKTLRSQGGGGGGASYDIVVEIEPQLPLTDAEIAALRRLIAKAL